MVLVRLRGLSRRSLKGWDHDLVVKGCLPELCGRPSGICGVKECIRPLQTLGCVVYSYSKV